MATRARRVRKEAKKCSEGAQRPQSRTPRRGRDRVPCVRGRALARPLAKASRPHFPSYPAIVINLERREDRMKSCELRLGLHCQNLRFSRFIACDGRKTEISGSHVAFSWETNANVVYQKKRAIRKGWDDLHTYKDRQLAMSPGERGCAMSHIWAWQHCLHEAATSDRPLLVLEDDAAPTPQFQEVLARALEALPSDAHVLYLGYSQAADWRREISAEVVEAEYVWTTVAYIVWPAGARILLSRLPVDQPVDNWMAALCAKGDLKSYCVRPKIVHQADAWNVNSDVGHSDEHYWGPSSDIQHSDEFYWGPEAEHGGEYLQPSQATAAPQRSLFWGNESDDSDESME